jgi:hypothetical protein
MVHARSGNCSVPAFGSVTSGNWAGYAAFGNHFRFVEADYSIPSVNCAASPDGSQAAVWAGLDGFGNSTVEQEGTFAECSGGSASYFAFWEMFPNPAVVFTNVSPGDAIHVSTYFASGHWNLQLVDRTTGGGFQVSETCSTCKNVSAEVISEAPNGGPPSGLLADFGQAGFNHIGVTSSTGTRGNMLSTLWKEDSITEVSPATNATMQTVSVLEGPASGANGGYGNQAFTALARNSGG